MRSMKAVTAMAAAFALAGSVVAHADERMFTHSYEAKTLPKGTWEFEQWGAFQWEKNGGSWNTLKLREEIEYGVTDVFTAAIYLNSEYQANRAVPGFADESVFGFTSLSTEFKLKLSDPSVDPVGVLLYAELGLAPGEYEIELKLVLSKSIGPWTFAYNFISEFAYADSGDPAQVPRWTWEYELFNTAGISYAFTPHFALGVEAVDAFRWDIFGKSSTHAVFVGPNVHVAAGTWWATLTLLRQVGTEYMDGDNTNWSVQLIIGFSF